MKRDLPLIELPDGTKRIPTKEEILDGVRTRAREQFVSGNGNVSQTAKRTDSYFARENRQFDNSRSGTAFKSQRRDRFDESDQGGSEYANGGIRAETRQTGRDYSSTDERDKRFTTSDTDADARANNVSFSIPVTTQQQVKKPSVFSPYRKAFKDAFSKPKSKPKTKPVRLLSDVEAKSIREDLIQIILKQSEHFDAFIIATTKGHDKSIIIWSDIDKKDATTIANFLIRRAKRDPQAARIVRELLELNERIELAEIGLPRAYRTLMTYIEKGFSIH